MPVSGQPAAQAEPVATAALLRSGLVRRALAEAASANTDAGTKSHIRQTTIARAYHEALGKLDHETLQQLEQHELLRGPDFKRIHRGSIYGLPPPHRITEQQRQEWLSTVRDARRNARTVKRSVRALPPITANGLRVAAYLAKLATEQDHTLYSLDDLARDLDIDRATVTRAIAALRDRRLIIVHRRQRRTWNGYQLHRLQARNDYEIHVTRNTP